MTNTLTCDICHEPMTPDRGYIYGVHAKCAQLVIRKVAKERRNTTN